MTAPHGTYGRYQTGCRCDSCREASAQYQRDYRAARRIADPPIAADVRRRDKPFEWMAEANCAGMDPAFFHPERGDIKTQRKAQAVCRRCVVAQECLDHAHTDPIEPLGIRGGYTSEERRQMRAAQRRTA